MSIYFFKMLFSMLVCLSYAHVSILAFNSQSHFSIVKCIETERQALLDFKQGIIDHSGMLSTWRDDDNNRDCCKWKGIQCNNQTGHVLMLHLRGNDTQYLTGAINITSFIHLPNIQHLDLSYNYFLRSHFPQLIGSFTNLRYLNLSYSGCVWRIPYNLRHLSKLRYLDLSYNDLDGEIPYQLGNLSQLRYLGLGENFLNGIIPSQLGNLSQLRYLDLSDNYLHGTIPSHLGNLSQLRYLDLGENSLNGIIPSQLGKLTSLRYLSLAGNDVHKINNAKWLSSLTSLTTLDLSSLHNVGSSHHWLQFISEIIPNLRELRLADCSLSDDDISLLFPSHSNLSTSLSVLHLSHNMLTSSTFHLLSNYTFNLKQLYLQENNIVLSSPFFPNFPSLVILDLSYNNLTSLIFQGSFTIGTKLRELHLLNCSLTDKSFLVPSASIQNSSSSLANLDLSYNLLKSSAIFNWISNFTTNLQVLTINSNKLQGKIPTSLGNICTVQELHLEDNNLSGEISSFIQKSSWCNRHILQALHLSSNRINGTLPNLSNFTSLKILDLSYNQITGEIPKSIGLLQELEYLSLPGNHFEGDITESHLSNLYELVVLDFTRNSLSLKFGPSWVPPFQLYILRLGSCKLGPSFPGWLQTQSQLVSLDLSQAGIDDFVPEWFWSKLQSMGSMNMSFNSLKGTIPNLPINLIDDDDDDQAFIFLSSNNLEGEIPAFLSQAYSLDLSKNKISNLNTFLCGKNTTTNMHTLDLSNNQIMGQLPDCWEHLNSLKFLDLKNNNLSGKIPKSMDALFNLEALVLRNNSLTGELPFTMKNCTRLVILDVSENLLTGRIPSWIGESLQQLKILSLRVNRFSRTVPVRLCYLKQIHLLDLSRNHLSGGIPRCLKNFTALVERSVIRRTYHSSFYDFDLLLIGNNFDLLLTWKGQEQLFLNPKIFLKSIDLSSNDITGEIPKEVGYLLGLVSLNLAGNNLNGEIPLEIGNLSHLDFLDLSRNHLSGRIPSTLSKIDGLGYLNLSNNDLSGRIPWEGHLQDFDASSFQGNICLCGQQLNKSCPGDDTGVQPQGHAVHGEDDNSTFYEALYMSLGLGFFVGFWGLLGPILLWQPWRTAYGRFLNRLTDWLRSESAIGGSEAKVYKCHR